MQRIGFTHKDAIHDGVTWNSMATKYTSTDLLTFGFTWEDMVSMGVTAKHLKQFTWPQLRHSLNLDARKLLSTDMTLSELAELNLNAHQLSELGFNWDTLMAMGADVHTLKVLNLSFDDIKLLWNPPAGQLHKCGYHDRRRLQKRAGTLRRSRTNFRRWNETTAACYDLPFNVHRTTIRLW